MSDRAEAEALLVELARRSIQVWAQEDEVSVRAPKGAFTSELRARLLRHKRDLLALLGQNRKHAPCSFAQERLWFLGELEQRETVDVVFVALRLRGPLSFTALVQTFFQLACRHETLRTVFAAFDGRPLQVVLPEPTSTLEHADLRRLALPAAEAEARRLAVRELQRPFDLQTGPLMRTQLLRLADRDHVLLISIHHIAADGWSLGVLDRELSLFYGALSLGETPVLPPLPIQYSDFAVSQRRELQGEVLAGHLAYWRRELSAPLPVVLLPTDRPRQTTRRHEAGAVALRVDRETTAALLRFGRERGATPYMTLLAAFLALLLRYTGQRDLIVGTPIANRSRREAEGLIGFFVNHLVLRADLAGRPDFTELVGRVRETALQAYEHQELPFEKLVEELKPERSLNRHPLFQIGFALQNTPGGQLRLPGLAVQEDFDLGFHRSPLDLVMHLLEPVSPAPPDEGLEGKIVFRKELFDATTLVRLAQHFVTLLRGLAEDPTHRIGELPFFRPSELHQLRSEWSGAARQGEDGLERPLDALFLAQVARAPDAVALTYQERVLSYRELARRAMGLARHLRSLGVGPDVPVALWLERGPEMVLGILAALLAGGSYVPLDPDSPAERLAFYLDECRAVVVLTRRPFDASLPEKYRRCAVLLDGEAVFPAGSGAWEAPGADPRQCAYILFTSGSTGRPKGVVVEHRQATSYLRAATRRLGLRPGWSYLLVQPLSVDASTTTLFGALMTGGSLHLASREEAIDPAALRYLMGLRRVDVLKMAPSHLSALGPLPRPRHLLVLGGEPIPSEKAREWLAAAGRRYVLHNHYGPTETTVATLTDRLDPTAVPTVALGRPLAHALAYVADERLRTVPAAVFGELVLGGQAVTRGYLARPGQTAASFVPDPWSGISGGRLYRTGDLARFLADGRVELLGRRDGQIKLRGFRIEPAEIERALRSHPEVREAAVVLAGGSGTPRLIAHVVSRREAAPDGEDLRRWLGETLPPVMIPAEFLAWDALPRSAHGKLDRRTLAETGAAPSLPDALRAAAPRNATEELLVGLWEEVLERSGVGIDDNFFELGGHSLLATQVVSRARQVLGVELPVRSLFARPTISELAQDVQQRLAEGAALQRPPIVPVPRGGRLPLSFAQQRLWFLDQLHPGNPVYNMPDALRLKGPLHPAALAKAFQEVVQRHEALRTSFPTHEGEPFQSISVEAGARLLFIDLMRLPEAAGSLLVAEALRPFDLRRDPLIRALLLKLSEEDHVLFLNLHHIVSDGWSQEVLHRELARLYEDFSQGRPSSLARLVIQYADFAAWQRKWLAGEAWKRSLEELRRRFVGLSELRLPTDRPRTAEVTLYRGAARRFALPAGVEEPLRHLARRHGASLYMTLLAGFMAFLSRICGQREVVVGSPVANRNHREIEGLIGFFVNMMVMRGDLTAPNGSLSYSALIPRVRQVALEGFAFQDVPFDQLARELAPQRDLRYHPFFQVTFVLQNAPRSSWALPGLHSEPLEVEAKAARFDIELFMWDETRGLKGSLVYNTDLFDATSISRFVRGFSVLLHGAAEEPETDLDELPLIEPAERHQMLVEWNDRDAKHSQDALLHRLFEAQVERTPEAVALAFEEGALSYRELDERANRMADELCRRGTRPEHPVGVLLERSAAMVAAVLGILKAGGVYLPLDPESPPERLAFVVNDSGCAIVVSRGCLARRLPATVAVLDPASPGLPESSLSRPPVALRGDNAAYLIYTSGSTGAPKGVMNVHHSIVGYLKSLQTTHPLYPQDRFLQKAPTIFDASLREIFWPLITGARLRLAPPGAHRDPRQLLEIVRRHAITVLGFVPSLLPYFLDELAGDLRCPLRRVVCSGEALPMTLRRRFHEALPQVELVNSYGPAEAAVATVTWSSSPRDRRPDAPIGRGTANTSTYLLDSQGRPVPLGSIGEIHLAGVQLSRGYLRSPRETAAAFVPNPLQEGRLYRTGDLARHRGDGALLFVGRRDLQVKVRGMRVEPGEVEAALRRHPAVSDAAVVAREDDGHRRLLAYVVESKESRARRQEQRVRLWREVHDNLHGGEEGSIAVTEDPTSGTAGWISSFTGQPIPPEEMDEWVENTVHRILVTHPRRVLEIGCGSGLLLERIAPRGSLYVGTDISRQALEALQRRLALSEGHLPHVRLLQKEADDFEGLDGPFDTVVLNSVIQYLPGVEYLLRVLSGAVAALAPGGTLFVGDVRSLPLLDSFCALVELHRSPESLTPAELRERVEWRRRREEELVLEPAFFLALRRALPRIGRVRILPKDGRFHNELNLFRYDAVIHLDESGGPSLARNTLLELEASGETLDGLRQFLLHQESEAVWLQNVRNSRLAAANRLKALLKRPEGHSSLADLRRELDSLEGKGVEPDELRSLGEELSYRVELTWAEGRDDGSYDAFLWRGRTGWVAQETGAPRSWTSYVNDPLHEQAARDLQEQLQEHLRQSLPDYMLPASVDLLGELPALPSGKIDRAKLRKALPEASGPSRRALSKGFVPPQGPTEETLARIWSDVIGIEGIGSHDNFFELGGDSILSIQVVAKARQHGLAISPRDVFEHQSIAELAKRVLALGRSRILAEQGLVTGAVPLTPIQRAFFDWDLAEAWHYNQTVLLKTRRPLEPRLLEKCLDHLLRHHDALRLRFYRDENGGWAQRICDPEPPGLLTLDCSRLADEDLPAAIERASSELQASLDLARGPLVRGAWFDLGNPRAGRLLVVVHHLAVDRVSWGVLLEDLESVYRQLEDARPVSLPAKTTSLLDWATKLSQDSARPELELWLSRSGIHRPLPVDFEGRAGENTVLTADSVPAILGEEATRVLLKKAASASPEPMEAFLLTALLQAFCGWTGRRSLLVEVERHGREPLFDGVDLSRTVGWFTMLFPILLQLPKSSESPWHAVREQLEAIPRRGIGYGQLRYSPDELDHSRLALLPRPEVSVNYMGRLDRILPDRPDRLFEYADESIGRSKSRHGQLRHRWALGGGIVDGRLRLRWTYSRSFYRRETIELLARTFLSRLEVLTSAPEPHFRESVAPLPPTP